MIRIIKINKDNCNLFDSEINKYDAIIKFFLPKCGHCIEMENDWNTMVNKLKKQKCKKNVNVFEVNGESFDNINSNIVRNIRGFPTIIKTTNGSYDSFMDTYHGNRSHSDMLKWSLSKLRKSLQKSKTKKRKPPKRRVSIKKKKKRRKSK